jgi:peptidoglycan/xylan/chitin deacetylase (PgdA/CDA1 family)
MTVMTLEEALEASGAEPVNDIFQINPENRAITVPESEKIFGVANDGNTERKHFRCPKVVGDNIDLSTMHLYINYQNANGQKYPYLVEDVQTDGDYITFTWLIGPDVVAYKGQIKFIVCAKKGDGTIPEWNTTIAEGTVLEGLEATDEVVARNPDIIEQILTRLDSITEPVIQESSAKRITKITDGGKEEVAAAVSFIDDDCRSAAYATLFPLIKELDIPYTLACPPGKIGADLYMTQEQLLEMYNYGVTISCHTWAETNMDTLSKDQLEENLKKCVEKYREWGITDVNSYAYTQGKYSVDNMSVVKKYFDMGFLVNKDINIIPYETYYMRRVGLFPTDNSFSLSDAKAYVDKLLTSGGWLIFMTHCWTSTFNATELKDLVSYIKGKGIRIVDVNEMIEKTGNVVDIGYYKKDDLNTGKHYFIVDSTGKIWTDQFSSSAGEKIEIVELTIKTSYSIGKETSSTYKGKLLALTSTNTKFRACEPVSVTDCSEVLITGWSYSGYGIYSFLDESGECVSAKWATKTASEGGNSVVEERISVPAGAKTLIIAGHSDYVLPGLSKVRQ